MADSVSAQRLSPRERRSRLEVLISDHVIQGYEVVDREQTWAEMYKAKRFSLRGCLRGLGVLYLVRYLLLEEEDAVRLEVTPEGQATVQHVPVATVAGGRR